LASMTSTTGNSCHDEEKRQTLTTTNYIAIPY